MLQCFSPCPLPKQEKSGLYFFLSRKTSKMLLKDTRILTSQRCKCMRDGVWLFNLHVGQGLKKSLLQDAVHKTPLVAIAVCHHLCRVPAPKRSGFASSSPLGKIPWNKSSFTAEGDVVCLAGCSSVGALLGYHKGNHSCPKASRIKCLEGVLGRDVAREKIPSPPPAPLAFRFPWLKPQ